MRTHTHTHTHSLTYSLSLSLPHLVDQLFRYYRGWNQRSRPHDNPGPSSSTEVHCALHAVVAGRLVVVAGGGGGTGHGARSCPTTVVKTDTYISKENKTSTSVWHFVHSEREVLNPPPTKSKTIFLFSYSTRCRDSIKIRYRYVSS